MKLLANPSLRGSHNLRKAEPRHSTNAGRQDQVTLSDHPEESFVENLGTGWLQGAILGGGTVTGVTAIGGGVIASVTGAPVFLGAAVGVLAATPAILGGACIGGMVGLGAAFFENEVLK